MLHLPVARRANCSTWDISSLSQCFSGLRGKTFLDQCFFCFSSDLWVFCCPSRRSRAPRRCLRRLQAADASSPTLCIVERHPMWPNQVCVLDVFDVRDFQEYWIQREDRYLEARRHNLFFPHPIILNHIILHWIFVVRLNRAQFKLRTLCTARQMTVSSTFDWWVWRAKTCASRTPCRNLSRTLPYTWRHPNIHIVVCIIRAAPRSPRPREKITTPAHIRSGIRYFL